MKAFVLTVTCFLVSPHSSKAFADEGKDYEAYLALKVCPLYFKDLRQASDHVLEGWKRSDPELIEMFEKDPPVDFGQEKVKEFFDSLSDTELAERKFNCAYFIANASAKKVTVSSDSRFLKPETTWGVFVEALKSANRETIAECLSGRAKTKWETNLSSLSDLELEKMGESFVEIQVMGDFGEHQDAMVTRSTGQASVVLFGRIGGSWKITDM